MKYLPSEFQIRKDSCIYLKVYSITNQSERTKGVVKDNIHKNTSNDSAPATSEDDN